MWGAGRHFGRVRRFHSSVIAVLQPASVNDGAVGSKQSAPATRTIARTRHGHSVRGRKAIANTGAIIGARTRNTARAIAPLPGSGSVIAGGMRLRRALQGLQRWTHRCRIHPCLQGFIGSSRQPLRSLQRWMRGWWKSLWYQRHTGKPWKFAKSSPPAYRRPSVHETVVLRLCVVGTEVVFFLVRVSPAKSWIRGPRVPLIVPRGANAPGARFREFTDECPHAGGAL